MRERLTTHWENNAGGYGWLAVFGLVAVLDIKLPQTLSSYADKLLEDRRTSWIPPLVGGIISAHVLNQFDNLGLKEYDPIDRLGKVAGWLGSQFVEVMEAIDDQPQL